jgi:tetratricopeptide (TPR) repeat protein
LLGLQSLLAIRSAWLLGITAAIGFAWSSSHARNAQDPDAQVRITSGFSLLGSYLAGRVASRDNDLEAAAEYYRRALARDPDNADMLGEAFKMELGAGNMRKAARVAERLSEAGGSEYGFAYLLRGTEAFKRGDYAQAERLFRTVGDSPIIQLTDRLALAWTQFAQGAQTQAIETLSTPQSADRSRYFQLTHTALALDLAGRPDEARKKFEQAFQRHSSNRRLIEAYARHAARRGDDALVKKILGPYQSGDGADRGLRMLYADLESAEEPELLATSARDGLSEVYFGIGAVLSNEQAAAASRFYLQLALYLRPEFDRAHYLLAEIETRDQRLEAALQAYRGVTASSSLYLDARIRGAFVLNALDRNDEGIGMLTAMTADYPDEPRLLQAIGNILRDQKEYGKAADYYTQAIDMIGQPGPEDWMYFYARGICHERLKEWDKAEADLEKALEFKPTQASVMNYLGYSWVDQNMHLEKAMDLIREAVRREPNNGYYVDSLGWAYYKLGKFDDAVDQLEKAVELRPEDPILNDHLGDAYWRVGRRREARFQWSHALSLDPEPEDRKEILEKLADGLQDGNRKAELEESDAASVQ